jgi:hypothetical protein
MNMTAHPATITPSYAGHSIGRWDGDVLVVDTVGFEPGVLAAPVKHSDQLQYVINTGSHAARTVPSPGTDRSGICACACSASGDEPRGRTIGDTHGPTPSRGNVTHRNPVKGRHHEKC